MAKASTGSVGAKQTRPSSTALPAGKKAVAAKAVVVASAGLSKTAERSVKSAGAKPGPTRVSALQKPTMAKAARKQSDAKSAVRAVSPGKKTIIAKSAPARTLPGKVVIAKPNIVKDGGAKNSSAQLIAAKKMGGKALTAKAAAASRQAPSRRVPARVTAPSSAPRRPRATASPKRTPSAPRAVNNTKPGQTFAVSHLNEADFKADGLRSYAQYRDLGIADATAGLCQAHVIRFVPPCTEAVRKRHQHAADLQLIYVLKGWMKNEFEGIGEQMMSTGSCWLQPSGIKHTVLDYSADCEVLEIVVPADFKTDELA